MHVFKLGFELAKQLYDMLNPVVAESLLYPNNRVRAMGMKTHGNEAILALTKTHGKINGGPFLLIYFFFTLLQIIKIF